MAAALLVAAAALAAAACGWPPPAAEGSGERFATAEEAFQELRTRPEHRAMAVALDNNPHFHWAYGRSWGQASPEAALDSAFTHCDEQRRLRGVRSPCRTYAVGDERVWGLTPR